MRLRKFVVDFGALCSACFCLAITPVAAREADPPLSVGVLQKAEAEKSVAFARMERLLRERQLVPLQQEFAINVVREFSAKQRNRIALLLAQKLAVHDHPDNVTAKDWPHFVQTVWRATLPAMPVDFSLKVYAAELLAELSGERADIPAETIPYLILALEHPERRLIGQYAFGALYSLTSHHTGEIYWMRLPDDERLHARIVAWWRHWWEQNRHRHPVYDADLELRSKGFVVALVRRLNETLAKEFPQECGLSASLLPEIPLQANARGAGTFIDLVYSPSPRMLTSGIGPQPGNTWLHVRSSLVTPDLPGAWFAPTTTQIPNEKPSRVYQAIYPGTDLQITVDIASPNPGLIQRAQALLTQIPGPK